MITRYLHRLYILVAVLLAIGVLAACAPATPTGTFPPSSGAPAQVPTNPPADTPTTAPTSAPTKAPAQAPVAPAAATVQLATNASLGSFLSDGKGMTLYLFLKDTKNTSNCYDACAAKWPPLLSQDKPTLGTGVKSDLIGSTQRKDGSSQVTYNGWPLYYYQPDQKAGDTLGQGVGSVWYVVTADGDPFTGGAAPSNAPNNTPAATASVSLKLANNATLGNFLVDGKGMTLYLFTKDTTNTSNCYDACATKWPPLLSQSKPTLGDGIVSGLIGTTQRKDGTTQVTYNGWPLYHYQPDQKAGDTLGQGVGSVWFVINASGDAIKGGAAPAQAPAAAPTAAPANPYKY